MRRIGGPFPRLVNATRRSLHSKPPSSPPIRFVSWSTPFRAIALYAAATPSRAPLDKRIFLQDPSRSSPSLSCITPRWGQPRNCLRTTGCSRKKARLLESNRASGTAHGGRENYRLDRFFEPPPLRPPDFDPPLDRLPEAFRADVFLPPDLRAPAFFAPPARDAVFRVPPAFFPVDFLPLEDRDALLVAFFLDPPDDPDVDPLVDPDPDRLAELDGAPVPPPEAIPPPDRPLLELDPVPVRPELEAAPPPTDGVREEPNPDEVPPNPPLGVVEVPPSPELPDEPELVPPRPPSPPPAALPPPPALPPPASEDSCFLPDPFGRPLLPRGAPPPKRSSSSSSSSSSASLTTVASESVSSSSSASSALSHRRSL